VTIPPLPRRPIRSVGVEIAAYLERLGLDETEKELADVAELRAVVEPRIAEFAAHLSVATDYAVSQVVDATKGVHGTIRKADFG
jgi:DNA-binding FadR family transcriptional regulator